MTDRTVEEILSGGYHHDLEAQPLDVVRARRDAINEVETAVSYLRRVAQGRLDIAREEAERRRAGRPPGDLSDLVERLPDILGDRGRSPGAGRVSTVIAPGPLVAAGQARLDAVVSTSEMAHLPDLDEATLDEVVTRLDVAERDLSAQRRALHDVLDRLHGEIVRRYKSGEATVDGLLRPD